MSENARNPQPSVIEREIEYTEEERANITGTLKHAAFAMAEFWDAVREVEQRTGATIEFPSADMSGLAAEFDAPAALNDVPDEAVWEWFREYAEVRQ